MAKIRGGEKIDFFWNFNMLSRSNYVVICTNHEYDIVFEKKVCLTPWAGGLKISMFLLFIIIHKKNIFLIKPRYLAYF